MDRAGDACGIRCARSQGGKGCVRFVGGCVRNFVLGKPISDLDLSTQLTPDETEAALGAAGIKSVPTARISARSRRWSTVSRSRSPACVKTSRPMAAGRW
ncbi:MAG: hypothetical protein WDN06_18990 [Asticcacaulis sp.]